MPPLHFVTDFFSSNLPSSLYFTINGVHTFRRPILYVFVCVFSSRWNDALHIIHTHSFKQFFIKDYIVAVAGSVLFCAFVLATLFLYRIVVSTMRNAVRRSRHNRRPTQACTVADGVAVMCSIFIQSNEWTTETRRVHLYGSKNVHT